MKKLKEGLRSQDAFKDSNRLLEMSSSLHCCSELLLAANLLVSYSSL